MGFERCHPAVNFIFFAAVIAGTVVFQHPVFLALSVSCAVAYSIKRIGWKAAAFDALLLPCVIAFALYYSSYHHFGITVLYQNFIDNNMTLESLVYGCVIGFVCMGVIVWFSCIYSIVTTDKVVYLFGKASPRLSLFLAILLRMVPRIKKEARKINTAQQGIGKGVNQGNLWQRTINGMRIFYILITWTIDALSTASDSMRSRGSSLRGRTAFSIYRFDNRDRAYVIGLFACMTLTMMAVLLKQTDIVYDPRILMNPITPVSLVFYAGYAALCLMPMGLDLWTEYTFRQAQKKGISE